MSETPITDGQSQPNKERKHALAPIDQEEMKNVSITLLKKFFEDYPDKLPDAIILPDTSARPLAYLLKSVLEKASQKRGVTVPKIYFFNFVETPEQEGIRREMEFGKLGVVRSSRPKRISQGIVQAERIFTTRAGQIMQDLKRQGIDNPEIAIFDDEVSPALRTSKGINRAFGKNNIPLYAFFSDLPEDEFRLSEIKVRTGGFLSRIPYGLALEEIGVIKDRTQAELVSEPINPPNINKMATLRSDLSRIGQEVASALNL